MPVFGCDLEDHLRRTNRDIASVIEDSVCTLLEIGMDEEVSHPHTVLNMGIMRRTEREFSQLCNI